MAEEIVIKIVTQTGQAEKNLGKVRKDVDKLSDSEKKLARAEKELNFQRSDAGKKLAKIKIETRQATLANNEQAKAILGVNSARKAGQPVLTQKQKLEKKLNDLHKQEAVDLEILNQQIRNQQAANVAAAKSALGMADATQAASRAMTRNSQAAKAATEQQNRYRAQAGLNNAILLETGRLASDANFGYTAIANNLSQLISLFGSFSKTAGGFTNSIKLLGRSLLGSGGLLIAIQLLIAFGPKIIEFFTGGKTAAEEEAEAFKKNTEELEKNLRARKKASQDAQTIVNITGKNLKDSFFAELKDLDKAEDQLITLADTLSKLGIENTNILKDETIAVDARVEIAEKLVKIYDEQTRQDSIRNKQAGELITKQQALNKLDEMKAKNTGDFQDAFEKGLEKQKSIVKTSTSLIKNYNLQLTNSNIAIRSLNKEIDILKKRGVILEPTKEDKEGTKNFIRQYLDFTRVIERSRATARRVLLESEENILKEQQRAEIAVLDNSTNVFLRKQKERFNKGLITEKQYNDTVIQAYDEKEEAIAAITLKYNTIIADILRERQRRANEISLADYDLRQRVELEQSLISTRIEGKRIRDRIEFREKELEIQKGRIERELQEDEIAVDRKAELELRLTQIKEEQTGIRMRLADAEAQAVTSGIAVVGDALKAFSSLSEEGSKQERDLAIASTLVSTYLSAQKAYESQFKPLATVDSPIRGAVAATAAVASGLARVKAIKDSFDKRQPAQTAAAPTTPPQFNVVGPGTTDQLLGIINAGIGDSKVFVNVNEIDDGLNTIKKVDTTSSITG